MKLLTEKIIFSLLLSLGIFFLGSIVYAWTSPASNPPNGNVSAPINAGSGSQTKSGALTVTQLTASIANGTAPLVVTSQTKVANLNADLLDGLDASGFGDATAANQTTILGRIGANNDAANMDTTLFGGLQYLWDNRASFGGNATLANQSTIIGYVDNAYSACWSHMRTQTNMTCSGEPSSMGSFTKAGCVRLGTIWESAGSGTAADSMEVVYCLPR